MTIFFLSLSVGIVCIGLTPKALTRSPWQIRFPRIALAGWLTAFWLGVLSLITAVISAVYLSMIAGENYAIWWNIAVTVTGWLSLLLTGAAIALLLKLNETLAENRRELIRNLASQQVTDLQVVEPNFPIIIYGSDEISAYAVGGRDPKIFVSSALISLVKPEHLQAILAHEYAHIRLKHDGIRRIIEINASSLPFVKSGQKLRQAVSLLIELIADDAAARQVGPAALANALTLIAKATGDPLMELRAKRLANYRWPKTWRRKIPHPIHLGDAMPD